MRQQTTAQREINAPEPGRLLFVARDPGTTEMRKNRPLVGRAGREVFDPCLREAGIRRSDVNITNVVRVQPPNNVFAAHRASDISAGLSQLHQLVAELRPSLIVAMGNEAAYALIDDWPGNDIRSAKGIEDRRGYAWDCAIADCAVLATIHPAAVLRSWVPWRMLLSYDFKRARKLESVPLDELRPKRTVEIVT